MASVATATRTRKESLLTIHKHELDESAKASPWRTAWREGFAPQFSARALEILARALADDDLRILQGVTIEPPPLPALTSWTVEAADPVAFLLWQSLGLTTVGEVEAAWAAACYEADRLSPGSVRRFTSWWDGAERRAARLWLYLEINHNLRRLA